MSKRRGVLAEFTEARGWRRGPRDGSRWLHDLPHFMATEMLDAGVSISIVSACLAHARASTTLNLYAHAVPGGDARAAQTPAEVLAAGSRPWSRRPAKPLVQAIGRSMITILDGDEATVHREGLDPQHPVLSEPEDLVSSAGLE